MKLSDRIEDTKNRKCDNNDIDYGYNMAIDDWLPEIIELENKAQELKNKLEIYNNHKCENYMFIQKTRFIKDFSFVMYKCQLCDKISFKRINNNPASYEKQLKMNTFGT